MTVIYLKKIIKSCILLLLILILLLSGCGTKNKPCKKHTDSDNNGVCDVCSNSVFVYLDFYTVNDLYSGQADLEKLTQYLNKADSAKQNSVFLSAGNMLQGEDGQDTLQWMNELEFAAMAIGNHDLELGTKYLEESKASSNFPLLAINIFEVKNNKPAKFCSPSTLIKVDGLQIGIIGAIGDCYSDIEAANGKDIYFKTGAELTELVKDESNRLRKKGADFIVYLLHDGYDQSTTGDVEQVSGEQIYSYYDISLSNGYVDLVFEGYTSQSYRIVDPCDIYHLQSSSENSTALSHVEIAFNTATDTNDLRFSELVAVTDEAISNITPTVDDAVENNNGNDSNNNTTSNNPHNSNNSSQNTSNSGCKKHTDSDNNEICDSCKASVLVYFDFYAINDLHGKLADSSGQPGVDELTTYLKNARKTDQNAIFLSAGDMWQGASESNMTKGIIMTDWMNELDFAAMTIGNHEFDWGEEYVANNADFAEFPLLAINIYDRSTNKRASFCEPSVIVEGGGLQIGIIGAIGDCYSSIAVDKCDEVYFKVGSDLTSLVKAEAKKLRNQGADFIVYVLHDGYGSSQSGSLSSSQISSYYDVSLSDGFVDLVFEGHTHQGYTFKDQYGVYHLQNRGDNKGGISHAEVAINSVTLDTDVKEANLISTSVYSSLNDDPIVNKLLDKYEDQISPANRVLGHNSYTRNSNFLRQLSADLYYKKGLELWGNKYNIVLGGGFTSIRSPYYLYSGDVTYANLQSLFPFDNNLTLCSIKGRYLKSKFFETSNSDYYIAYGNYGSQVKQNIDSNATYYVVVDTYTAYYKPNNLTVIETLEEDIFARDLLAEYIENGGLS